MKLTAAAIPIATFEFTLNSKLVAHSEIGISKVSTTFCHSVKYCLELVRLFHSVFSPLNMKTSKSWFLMETDHFSINLLTCFYSEIGFGIQMDSVFSHSF
jgi:hypothetical protein